MKRTIILITFILTSLVVNAQDNRFLPRLFSRDVSHGREHSKLQKELSFETWEKKQPKVRLNAVKDAVEQSKETSGKKNKTTKLKRKENRIRKRIKT